jgi:hypothetical protein
LGGSGRRKHQQGDAICPSTSFSASTSCPSTSTSSSNQTASGRVQGSTSDLSHMSVPECAGGGGGDPRTSADRAPLKSLYYKLFALLVPVRGRSDYALSRGGNTGSNPAGDAKLHPARFDRRLRGPRRRNSSIEVSDRPNLPLARRARFRAGLSGAVRDPADGEGRRRCDQDRAAPGRTLAPARAAGQRARPSRSR